MFDRVMKRLKTRFSRRIVETRKIPWYTGPPTFPTKKQIAEMRNTPTMPPAQPSVTSPVEFAHAPLLHQQPENVEPNPEEDTPRSRQAVIASDPLEDTHPTQAVRATTKLVIGSYDHLFPPAQPGDDDYLEVGAGDPATHEEEVPTPPDDLPM
jgi:hypothetical protein